MENIGIHDKIEIDNRKFDVHTGILTEKKIIISEVFEEGMFLTSKKFPIKLRDVLEKYNYDYLSKVTQEFHDLVINELEMRYFIDDKIKLLSIRYLIITLDVYI